MKSISVHSLAFEGALLERGFWLYVWDVRRAREERFLYVGRTGDSSSPNAASPFNRMGLHLNLKHNAKANSLVRQLRARGVEPSTCSYSLHALGPLYPEQSDMKSHKPYRDKVAALEKALAKHLLERGFDVLGIHRASAQPDEGLLAQVIDQFRQCIDPVTDVSE